jgi:hypothetical protein
MTDFRTSAMGISPSIRLSESFARAYPDLFEISGKRPRDPFDEYLVIASNAKAVRVIEKRTRYLEWILGFKWAGSVCT